MLDRWAGLIGCRTPREFISEADGIRTDRYAGPVEFLAHLGEMIEAATAGPEEETKTVNIKLVSPEMVRERVNGLAA